MSINIIFFGQLAALTGTDKITCALIKDSDSLIKKLNLQYPLLVDTSFAIAVDKKVIKQNTILNIGATVALLPPFSGG